MKYKLNYAYKKYKINLSCNKTIYYIERKELNYNNCEA